MQLKIALARSLAKSARGEGVLGALGAFPLTLWLYWLTLAHTSTDVLPSQFLHPYTSTRGYVQQQPIAQHSSLHPPRGMPTHQATAAMRNEGRGPYTVA